MKPFRRPQVPAALLGVPHVAILSSKHLIEVAAIEFAVEPDPWPADQFAKIVSRRFNDRFGLVAEQDGRVVGYAVFDVGRAHVGLQRLVTHPERRRQGIGRCLADRIKNRLASLDRQLLTARVRESNLAGQLFLRSMGFAWHKTFPGFFTTTGEDGYYMAYQGKAPCVGIHAETEC